jgi:hypothetical protein
MSAPDSSIGIPSPTSIPSIPVEGLLSSNNQNSQGEGIDQVAQREDSLFWRWLHYARSRGLPRSWARTLDGKGRLVSFPVWWMKGLEKVFIWEDPDSS